MIVWTIFLLTAYLAAFILVPAKGWKRLWPAGIITIVLLYLIDNTFIRLGAFFYSPGFDLSPGIPVLYLVSSFAGGIVLIYLNPGKRQWRLPYLMLTAGVFLLFELIIHWLGYFHYNQWTPLNSYFLDIIGFSAVLWLSGCVSTVGKTK